MSVRGERIVYREREREVDYEEPQRRSYTTIKRYQVPDRDSDRRSAIFDGEEVKEEKITIKRGDARSSRSEVDFRGDRDSRREDIDIRITEREREPERRDVTYRVIERDSDRGGRGDYRVVEREREVIRAPSPPAEERVREYRFERDRDYSPARTRVERDYDVERYTKTTDYYNQPQPIVIRESAPQPIIIREERRGPQQIIIRREREEPAFELVERETREDQQLTVQNEPSRAASTVKSVVKSSVAAEEIQKPQEEDYYYERRIREVAREPRRRRDDDIRPSDSASQYSSDDSYVYERRERYIEDERDPHHRLHLAEGALAGAAAGGILASHRKSQGKAGHTGRDVVGGAALGALATEVISRARSRRGSSRRRDYDDYDDDRRDRRDRRRSYSRSRSRSQSKSRLNKLGGVAAVAAIGALAGYALKKSNNKETVVIKDGSPGRSRSRRRRHSRRYSDDDSLAEDNKALDPAHRNRRIAQAGLASAAAAGIWERFRSKSRGGRDRSKSRVRTALPIVATGLGGAALAGLYERNKANKAATRDAIIADERNRGRSRSRSRSRSAAPRAIDGRRDDPMVAYGNDPVYRDDYDEAPGSYRRRDRSMGDSPDNRHRSRSRARDLATAGAAAGAGAAIAHEAGRDRSRSRNRRHDDYDNGYNDEYAHGDYITPPAQGNYPSSNYFPPPPTDNNAYPPYNPADYPPAAAGAPRDAYDPVHATAEARERQEDREMKQNSRNDAANVSTPFERTPSESTQRDALSLDVNPGSPPTIPPSPHVAFDDNRADRYSRSARVDDASRSGTSTPRARSTSRVRFDLDSNVAHSPDSSRTRRRSSGDDTSEESKDIQEDERVGRRRVRRPSSHLMNDPHESMSRRSRSNSDDTVDLPARFDDHGNRRSDKNDLASSLSEILSGRRNSNTTSTRSERSSNTSGGAIEDMLRGLVDEMFQGNDGRKNTRLSRD